MDRRRTIRLLLTPVLLLCLIVYQATVDRQEMPSADVHSEDVKESRVVEGNVTSPLLEESIVDGKHTKESSAPSIPPTLPPSVTMEQEGDEINILCFGDSLTFGILVTGNRDDIRPYATYLQANLNELQQTSKENGVVKPVQVNHTGLPGYTAYKFSNGNAKHPSPLNETLDTFQREDGTSLLDMVIILAGTNDMLRQDYLKRNISELVITMHRMVLDVYQIPLTIALDIPRTAHFVGRTEMLEQTDVFSAELQRFAQSEPRTTFVPFPFATNKGDEESSKDSIHLTEVGYKKLAEKLAPVVQQSLQDAGLW